MSAIGSIPSEILIHERQWVVLCGFLKREGYELRARYQPDWVPSWTKIKNPTPLTWTYEDGEYSPHGLMDAIRVSDGARVMLKLVRPAEDHTEELACLLSARSRGADPRDHCLPLLAVLHPPEYPGHTVLVTHYCVPWNIWPFARVDEAAEFFTQVFEGLAFMHGNNIAHLDASHGNIVMDAVHLYQEPFHPMRPHTRLVGAKPARHLERHQSDTAVRYYFVDFEGAVHFDASQLRVYLPLVKRKIGQDKTVPEEQGPDAPPCDPFAVDVYCLGNVLVQHWLKAYKNVEFIRELAEAMTTVDPARRPTADEVVRLFQLTRDSLSASDLLQPLVQEPLYHSAKLRGDKMLAEHRKRKKAAAAAKRAARKQERAANASPVWKRLRVLFSKLLPGHRATLAQDASSAATSQ